ncbi:MAG: hypothetical protein IK006_06820 [Bacteroidaceae bacterium]|nr:hypothetical protein [Bacteroidaceae bacterium]
MRKFLLLFSFVLTAATAVNADDPADGYYRVHNLKTERYVYVTDNTGSVNYQAMDADMKAIQLWKNHDKTISDPASVIYLQYIGNNEKSGKYYDLQSQGTGVHEIIDYYVYLHESNGTYQLYAEGKYLCDNETTERDQGGMGMDRTGDYRRWVSTQIDVTSDEYFGITPAIKSGSLYYHPFFADFGFTPYSEGMKVWYISKIDSECVVISELKSEVIPARTPVIVECSSKYATNNRLDLKYSYDAGPKDNLLKGVYFNNPNRSKSADSRTEYDPATMRVLGLTAEGKLGYILSTVQADSKDKKQYLEANQSYLVVGENMADELPVVTEDEYQAILEERLNASVKSHATEKRYTVYQISGRKLGELDEKQLNSLPDGIYIVNNRKYVVGK